MTQLAVCELMETNNVIISKGNMKAEITLLGAQMLSLKKDGEEYLWSGDERFWKDRAPVLFPVCGGLKNDEYCLDGKKYALPKHGFAKKEMFTIGKVSESEASFVLTENERTLNMFPFKFVFTVKYSFDDKGLNIEYKVDNLDDKTAYFTLGAHEGYILKGNFEDYSIIFEKQENLHAYIPEGKLLKNEYISVGENTNELKLDYNYFAVDALVFKYINSRKVFLKHKTDGERLSVEFGDFEHLLLWTKPNSGYICIEPWSAVPDAVDCECDITKKPFVTVLKAGESKAFSHKIIPMK